ncbi:MAG: hypothetical protein U5N86_00660 [Planctomycetota bacterium]|nr:hypothetical protein [Planctomycetota bacterium]
MTEEHDTPLVDTPGSGAEKPNRTMRSVFISGLLLGFVLGYLGFYLFDRFLSPLLVGEQMPRGNVALNADDVESPSVKFLAACAGPSDAPVLVGASEKGEALFFTVGAKGGLSRHELDIEGAATPSSVAYNGDIFVVSGQVVKGSGSDFSYFVTALDGKGEQLWTKTFRCPEATRWSARVVAGFAGDKVEAAFTAFGRASVGERDLPGGTKARVLRLTMSPDGKLSRGDVELIAGANVIDCFTSSAGSMYYGLRRSSQDSSTKQAWVARSSGGQLEMLEQHDVKVFQSFSATQGSLYALVELFDGATLNGLRMPSSQTASFCVGQLDMSSGRWLRATSFTGPPSAGASPELAVSDEGKVHVLAMCESDLRIGGRKLFSAAYPNDLRLGMVSVTPSEDSFELENYGWVPISRSTSVSSLLSVQGILWTCATANGRASFSNGLFGPEHSGEFSGLQGFLTYAD